MGNENRLKEIRKKIGLTQEELAAKANVSQAHIANIERGKRSLDFELAQKLARALGCRAYELLPLEEQPESLTAEEQEILRIFRKSKTANTDETTTTKAG